MGPKKGLLIQPGYDDNFAIELFPKRISLIVGNLQLHLSHTQLQLFHDVINIFLIIVTHFMLIKLLLYDVQRLNKSIKAFI